MATRYIVIVVVVLLGAAALLYAADYKSLVPTGPHSTSLFQAKIAAIKTCQTLTLGNFVEIYPAATTDKPGSLFAETISGFSNVHFVTFGVSDIDRHNPISFYHHIAHLI